jgi:enoyl-CoA hydratase/carnithine racemase
VVVLRGAGGKAFIAGADLRELAEVAANPERQREYIELVESVMTRLETMPQAVIAAIEGPAVGAGLEIMAACDLRVAVTGARIGIPAAKLGLAITGQDLHRLERLVGIGRVKWLLLTGRLVTAEEAQSWGLVDAVFPESGFETELTALVADIGSNSSLSHTLTKQALLTYTNPAQQGAEAGFECSLPAWSSPSLAEGLAAFTERRPPDFPSVESRTRP